VPGGWCSVKFPTEQEGDDSLRAKEKKEVLIRAGTGRTPQETRTGLVFPVELYTRTLTS
jgi:hypothetical protein